MDGNGCKDIKTHTCSEVRAGNIKQASDKKLDGDGGVIAWDRHKLGLQRNTVIVGDYGNLQSYQLYRLRLYPIAE